MRKLSRSPSSGLGCRFPGGADSAGRLLGAAARRRDAIARGAADRWDVDAYYDPDPAAPGKMNTRWGAFLADVDQFDPQFFGISPREAAAWTRSSACCSRWPGRRSSTPASRRRSLAGSRDRRLRRHQHQRLRRLREAIGRSPAIDAYVGTGSALEHRGRAASRICSACSGPSWRSTPPARRRSSRVHLACQSLRDAASATWRSPAA